jgi:hypothetical protein
MSEENGNDNGGQAQVGAPVTETNWINTDGTFGDLSKAPEGVSDFITKKGFKDYQQQCKSHQELETMMGNRENLVRIPEEGDEAGFRLMATKLGCPLKPEDYAYQAKDGDPMDDSLLGLFKQAAYKDGMPQRAFQDTVDFQVNAVKSANKIYEDGIATEKAEAQKALRGRFASDDAYEVYTKKALIFADQFKLEGGSSAADVLERKGLAYDPEILDLFNALADSTKEDPLQYSQARTSPNKEQQLDEIKKNPAFVNAMDPDHNKLMEQFWAVYNIPNEG